MKEGYLIVSNETPNDHGFITPNSAIIWDRFVKNPVMLFNHGKKDKEGNFLYNIGDTPVGHWEDLHFDPELNAWIAKPVFSSIEAVKEYKTLYEEGNIKAASIGGLFVMKTTGEYTRDAQGNKIECKYVNEDGYQVAETALIYEISILGIPSNPDALTVQLYSEQEIVTLSTNINQVEMDKPEEKSEKTLLSKIAEGLSSMLTLLGSHKEPDGDELAATDGQDLPAVVAENLHGDMKEEPDGDEGVVKAELQTQLEAQAQQLAAQDEKLTQLAAQMQVQPKIEKIELKTKTEMETDGVKVVKPTIDARVKPSTKTFLELSSDEAGRKIIQRVSTQNEKASIEDFKTVLGAVLNDDRMKPILGGRIEGGRESKTPILNFNFTKDTKKGSEFSLGIKEAVERLHTLDRSEREARILSGNYETLGTSADLLATPDLAVVSWLPNVIYALFPNNNWEKDIPLFAAQMTEKNLGLVWANKTTDPTVTVGTVGDSVSPYSNDDQAVSLAMLIFAMQPVKWKPLYNHMLTYDKVSTDWAQALLKLKREMSDRLLYTLLAQVPSSSILKTTGAAISILGGTNMASFVKNTSFVGSVNRPALFDSAQFEQLWRRQNFEDAQFTMCIDDLMESYFSTDANSNSLLTRWIESNGKSLLARKNATFVPRGYYGLQDTATGSIVNLSGVIPATSQSITPVFIPSEIGIGIGAIDTFFYQDPTSYAIVQSIDMRAGISALRSDKKGLAAYTYGDGTNPNL